MIKVALGKGAGNVAHSPREVISISVFGDDRVVMQHGRAKCGREYHMLVLVEEAVAADMWDFCPGCEAVEDEDLPM